MHQVSIAYRSGRRAQRRITAVVVGGRRPQAGVVKRTITTVTLTQGKIAAGYGLRKTDNTRGTGLGIVCRRNPGFNGDFVCRRNRRVQFVRRTARGIMAVPLTLSVPVPQLTLATFEIVRSNGVPTPTGQRRYRLKPHQRYTVLANQK